MNIGRGGGSPIYYSQVNYAIPLYGNCHQGFFRNPIPSNILMALQGPGRNITALFFLLLFAVHKFFALLLIDFYKQGNVKVNDYTGVDV
jgi:hypothetical protein